ncbi:MAG TPA: DPP IV N-terminal domain-containing protein [Gemmatimonadaceae bacterium]|nr:DPP IV N-terminal domain-containing protein [Gemmatimonadaceae bacterium]
MTRSTVLMLAGFVLLTLPACSSSSDAVRATAPLTASASQAPSAVRSDGGPPASVVFYSRRGGGASKIYAMNPDGSGVQQLTTGPGNDLWPDISRNGQRIAFASNRSGNNEIYVLDLRSGSLANVSQSSADDNWPRWSPNGQELVFHSNRAGNYDLYVVSVDDGSLRQVTNAPALDQWPDWSPNGKQIAFRRETDVYVADVDGLEQNVRQLTFSPTVIDQMPAWSPDGKQLAYMSFAAGYCSVFLMDTEGNGAVNLTPKNPADASSAWCSRAPSWSRNGQRIYFMSARPSTSGDVELFSMAADGSALERLTSASGEDGGPRMR